MEQSTLFECFEFFLDLSDEAILCEKIPFALEKVSQCLLRHLFSTATKANSFVQIANPVLFENIRALTYWSYQ